MKTSTRSLRRLTGARFRSRLGRSRVEEVRAYAWPSQQIAMRHLGYRLEAARLLRLERRRGRQRRRNRHGRSCGSRRRSRFAFKRQLRT